MLKSIDIRVFLLKGHAFGSDRYKGPRKNITDKGVPFTYLGFRQRSERIVLKLADQLLSLIRLTSLLTGLWTVRKNTTILLYNSEIAFNIPIFLAKKLLKIRLVKFSAEIIDRSQFKNTLSGRLSRASHKASFRSLGRMPDKMIVFSHYLKDKYIRAGIPEEHILVQPNLTDFTFWQMESFEETYTIGYSGAPYMKDGLHDLLMAISLLSRRGRNLSLIIIGDATFGRTLIPELKEECKRLGIMDRITFTGLVNTAEVKRYLSRCSILAVTRPDTIQTRSGFPTKLGEYFAMGKPVLATRFGDMERYFTDGVDLVYAECGDPVSIMKKLEWMIDNPHEVDKIAQHGSDTARNLLEYQASIERILPFLDKVSSDKDDCTNAEVLQARDDSEVPFGREPAETRRYE